MGLNLRRGGSQRFERVGGAIGMDLNLRRVGSYHFERVDGAIGMALNLRRVGGGARKTCSSRGEA